MQMDRIHKEARVQILISCLVPIVGLSNFWRFPLLIYENGGGAFWYAYVAAMWTIGISMHFLNLCLGQFTSACGVELYSKFGLGFSGIAITQAYTCICISTYYCILSSYILIYAFYSLSLEFPWSQCKVEWGSMCVPLGTTKNLFDTNYTSSADYFFMETILQETQYKNGLFDRLNWKIMLGVLVSVGLVVLCLGINVSKISKTSSALIITPSVLMCALTGIAASMTGGLQGIKYFFLPDFSYLKKIDVWYNVISHCLFSVGQGLGILTMSSSRNYFTMNLRWISLIVAIFQVCETSLIGMITFAVLSNLSGSENKDLTTIIRSNNEGLAFIVYSIVLNEIAEIPFIMATIFFSILYVIALLSIAVLFQFGTTVISQLYPTLKASNIIALIYVSLCFVASVWCATTNEMCILRLFNDVCVPMLILITVSVELLVVMYCYGVQNVCLDIKYMHKKTINPLLRIVWVILLPSTTILMIIGFFIADIAETDILLHKIISLVVILTGILPIPICIIYQLHHNRNMSCSKRFSKVFDTSKFGPEDPDLQQAWRIFKDEELQKRIDKGDNCCVDFLKALVGK